MFTRHRGLWGDLASFLRLFISSILPFFMSVGMGNKYVHDTLIEGLAKRNLHISKAVLMAFEMYDKQQADKMAHEQGREESRSGDVREVPAEQPKTEQGPGSEDSRSAETEQRIDRINRLLKEGAGESEEK
jgi:hypothetical protein